MSTQISPEELQLQPLLASAQKPLTIVSAEEDLHARIRGEIDEVLDRIKSPAVQEIAQTIFDDLVRLFKRLSLIESNLRKLDTLLENLSLLEMIQFDVRALIQFIEARAMHTEGVSQRMTEVLDGISYGISHDVKRIFERELAGPITESSTPVVYGKIVHAHGLLANCLQQSLITLLQVFNPAVDPVKLFDDFEERLRQSLLLCNDLSSLMRTVRQAERENTPDALRQVVRSSIKFRDQSMQYLMYRDWRSYELLALALITSIENNSDSKDLLHQFGRFLEVLYGHVKMRACLKDMFPSSGEPAEEE